MAGAVNLGLESRVRGQDAEQKLFHLDALKKALPRDSSALLLIGDTKTCDAMVELFKSRQPKVVRRQVADELRQMLNALHQKVAQAAIQAAAQAEGPPATH
jgi:hypothetical protein